MIIRTRVAVAVAAVAVAGAVAVAAVPGSAQPNARAAQVAEPPQFQATLLRTYNAFDANQGVAVDDDKFFAVDNRQITMHNRKTGQPLLQFSGAAGGPIIHMDSGPTASGSTAGR